jgi:hypothetical protein
LKKFIRIALWTLLSLFVLAAGFLALFVYKVKNGFPVSYETTRPVVSVPAGKPAILLFSKATGFRHGESIDAARLAFGEMARRNNWFLYDTEAGGVFNSEQLALFHVVIFNNSTGRVLNDDQQKALEQYVETGGTLIGIHGAGDDSHHWPWYEEKLLGTKFSHHTLNPQYQLAEVHTGKHADAALGIHMPAIWKNTDEWYVFYSQPEGAEILCHIDGETILPSGNILWMKNKNFGMGKVHPVAWYRHVADGKTFYTSMGHSGEVWRNPPFATMIENAVRWGIR